MNKQKFGNGSNLKKSFSETNVFITFNLCNLTSRQIPLKPKFSQELSLYCFSNLLFFTLKVSQIQQWIKYQLNLRQFYVNWKSEWNIFWNFCNTLMVFFLVWRYLAEHSMVRITLELREKTQEKDAFSVL